MKRVLTDGLRVSYEVDAKIHLEWRERWLARNIILAYDHACEIATVRPIRLIAVVGISHASRLYFRLARYFEAQGLNVPIVVDISSERHHR